MGSFLNLNLLMVFLNQNARSHSKPGHVMSCHVGIFKLRFPSPGYWIWQSGTRDLWGSSLTDLTRWRVEPIWICAVRGSYLCKAMKMKWPAILKWTPWVYLRAGSPPKLMVNWLIIFSSNMAISGDSIFTDTHASSHRNPRSPPAESPPPKKER